MMKKKIELAHFQLTKNCNLRCWFCGQWGKKGFFADSAGTPMNLEDWKKVAEQLEVYGKEIGELPDIILWGGEPLLSPIFQELVVFLRKKGFELGIVTNGVLIEKYANLLKNEFKQIYVSVDGAEEEHDKIRGKGTFSKVKKNLELIQGGKVRISLMSVISGDNIRNLENLPEALCGLACDEVILQEMIGLTKEEIEDYKAWMKNSFGIQAKEIESWENCLLTREDKEEKINHIRNSVYSKKVKYLPHGSGKKYCYSPFRHIHVAWNGNVLYCTDFYDFCAGNVKKEKLIEIFHNEKSEKYREDIVQKKCVTCEHCSWIQSESFKL